ncbi:MAG: family 20 glycosylhydrolase, partial [Bacteroidales bacterium]|nr:family 20 glycosylhydrolase [Bacteroidales bacterium]
MVSGLFRLGFKYAFAVVFVIFSLCGIAFSQIIPTPQQVDYQDGSFVFNEEPSFSSKFVKTKIVPQLAVPQFEEQAYRLTVSKKGIFIEATTQQGLFYGLQSARQLYNYHKNSADATISSVPCQVVLDYPALQYRGWMDDISRGPIPTMDFLKKEILTMAYYKMNCFTLYTENVFHYESQPTASPVDALTAAEIKELEDFAAGFYVEIIGNQQVFAHAEKFLKNPFYSHLADTKTNFNPELEETYTLLYQILDEVAKAYKSPLFNINCDETEGLGSGFAKDYVGKVGAGKAYYQHIIKMKEHLDKYGKRTMMWGDIVAKDPEIAANLPKDILMIVWSYVALDSFDEMLKPFVDSGFDFIVASGVSCWSTVFPDVEVYLKNIANLIRDGYRNKAKGVLNTAWDDFGESFFNGTWHGHVWAAEMSWKPIVGVGDAGKTELDARLKKLNQDFNRLYFNYFNDEEIVA